MILLIHPPVVRPTEPPPGVAALAGALRQRGLVCRVIDANIEGLLSLLDISPEAIRHLDTWTKRALRHREEHIHALRHRDIYARPARYRRAVGDLARVLAMVSTLAGGRGGLTDYEDFRL
ncbi:MAG: hypothetical protein N2Z74_07490, partial [Syntrophales bacterium]|nr:hypothetical protein [Syntrophales bacterium]